MCAKDDSVARYGLRALLESRDECCCEGMDIRLVSEARWPLRQEVSSKYLHFVNFSVYTSHSSVSSIPEKEPMKVDQVDQSIGKTSDC